MPDEGVKVAANTIVAVDMNTDVITGIDEVIIDFAVPGKTHRIELQIIFREAYPPGFAFQPGIVGEADLAPTARRSPNFIELVNHRIKKLILMQITLSAACFVHTGR